MVRAYLLDDISSGNCADDGDNDVNRGCWHTTVVGAEIGLRGFGDLTEPDGDLVGNSCARSSPPLCPRFTIILLE